MPFCETSLKKNKKKTQQPSLDNEMKKNRKTKKTWNEELPGAHKKGDGKKKTTMASDRQVEPNTALGQMTKK